jgi:MarR family transcriptional regulator, organic hydroperoxide resistance regulator
VTGKEMEISQNGEREYDTWILLSRVYHMIAKLRRLELAKYNIQPVQAYILFILNSLGGETSPTELARYAYEDKSAISDILIRMEKQGLIIKSKEVKGNQRVKVKITEKGTEALKLSSEREYLRRVMSALSPEKLEQLDSCLSLIRDNSIAQFDIQEKKVVPPSKVSRYYHDKELFQEEAAKI